MTFEDKDGNLITIDAGTTVESYFDLDIYELACSYSFFQDERVDLAAGIGLFLMPLDFGLRASGAVDEDGSARFTAPLPVLGLRMDVALTPSGFSEPDRRSFIWNTTTSPDRYWNSGRHLSTIPGSMWVWGWDLTP